MSKTIEFNNVSKGYNLGLTRTSLPSVISGWVKKAARRAPQKSLDEQYLWALKNVSFEMEQGQSLALIGSNGAGKTTTLKLLANITKPTSGNININGKLSALIELGSGFHPDLTGRENIFLNGTILGLTRKDVERRFDAIVAFSELERFIDTPVKRYSSGMTVRLGFAVAANIEPDILLVDEVLAVGDASFRQKCMNRIHELLDNGTSIIFVSHNLWLVQAVCTSALYLVKGQVKHRGETAEVIDMYDRDINEDRARKLELSEPEQAALDADLEITDIEVLNAEGVAGADLKNDQSAEVRIHYLARQNLGQANFVVRILRSDGLTCCMMRTSLDNIPITLNSGMGVVSIVLDPLQLYGGTYYVQAIIRDATDSLPLTSKSSDWFYVKGSVLTHQEMNGVFEPRRRWNHSLEAAQFVSNNGKEEELTGSPQVR